MLNQGVKVIYITDHVKDLEQKHDFLGEIGTGRESDGLVRFADLNTYTLSPEPFIDDASVLVLGFRGENPEKDVQAFEQYNALVMNLLEGIGDVRGEDGFTQPFMVVVDDDVPRHDLFSSKVSSLLYGLKYSEVCAGFVISTLCPERYKNAQLRFGHFVVFPLYDPTEFIGEYFIFHRGSLVKRNGRESPCTIDMFDIKDMKFDQFIYTPASIGLWPDVATFSVD